MSNNYQENSDVYNWEELPPANILADLIEFNASTYPTNILARRVNLLTKSEKSRCDRKWRQIVELIEGIDTIIANRAEICNDPWKIIKTKNKKK